MAKEKPSQMAATSTESRLLLPEERKVCINMAQGDVPHNQRALALLALDQGVTQADASELSGLTIGQVRYWRDKYRQQRLEIFSRDQKKKGKASSDRTDSAEPPERVHPSDSQPTSPSAPPAKTKAVKKKKGKKKQDAKGKSGKKRRERDKNKKKKKKSSKRKKKSTKKGQEEKKGLKTHQIPTSHPG